MKRLEGDIKKTSYSTHGGCIIVEFWSVIFSALINNLINSLKQNKI
jgi:hypothetical protein